ncbi:MAG TPA: NAD(P)-binding oxidoreductase [Opitutales bacterium]|nr:NAD(P)-binding oxidoreductase [Opitutales bacterium]
MKIFIAGATGATGRLVAETLLKRGHELRVVVRSADRLPKDVRESPSVVIQEASLLDLDDYELEELTAGCQIVVSCLGHTLSFKGLYGKPRNLVTEATRRLCQAIEALRPELPVRFILMNSTGVRNRELNETIFIPQRIVIQLLCWLLPPHRDNEAAAAFLQNTIGSSQKWIEWVIVRPDTLVDAAAVTSYTVHPSPLRSAIFDSGKTSRINVADFMANLSEDDALWKEWRGQMPVLYNAKS